MSFFDEFCARYTKVHGAAPIARTDGTLALLCQEIDVLRVQIAYLQRRLEALEAKPKPPAGVNDEVES
jgi:hypothetical protein